MPRKPSRGASPAPPPPLDLRPDQFRDLLSELRTRAGRASHGELPALESAIARLECDAAARAIPIHACVEEPTPVPLAHRLLIEALVRNDAVQLERALRWLDVGHLWLANRRVREVASRPARITFSLLVRQRLDALLTNVIAAHLRQEELRQASLSEADLDAYLTQTIDALFAAAFAAGVRRAE